MTGDTPGQGNAVSGTAFRERLYASWWTWPLPVIAAVLLAAEVHMGYPGVRAWLPYVVLVPLAVAVPLWLGRTKVEVRDGELRGANTGAPLTAEGVAALASLRASAKREGGSVGRFGVGL